MLRGRREFPDYRELGLTARTSQLSRWQVIEMISVIQANYPDELPLSRCSAHQLPSHITPSLPSQRFVASLVSSLITSPGLFVFLPEYPRDHATIIPSTVWQEAHSLYWPTPRPDTAILGPVPQTRCPGWCWWAGPAGGGVCGPGRGWRPYPSCHVTTAQIKMSLITTACYVIKWIC